MATGNISVRTAVGLGAPEDQRWMGPSGQANYDAAPGRTGTFLRSAWAGPGSAWATQGYVPSGVSVGIVTASGLYVPYTDAATNGVGSDVGRGLLLHTVELDPTSTANFTAAIYWNGEVVESFLPTGHGVTAAFKADAGQYHTIVFI